MIILITSLLTACQCEEKTKPGDNLILIDNEPRDTATVKYNQAIMELPEFQNWGYINLNGDPAKKDGYSHFNARKVTTGNTCFYHIELIRQKSNDIKDSFIYPEEVVCYFRVSPVDNIIKILDSKQKRLLNLMSDEGRKYFKSCLENDSEP